MNYTIPSDNRELQRERFSNIINDNYTIPSDNRELQRIGGIENGNYHYTITGKYNWTRYK